MHLMYGVCHELQLLQKHGARRSTSLKIPHYKKKKKIREKEEGEIFIKFFLSSTSTLFFSYFVNMCVRRPLGGPAPLVHVAFHRWPVSEVITGRLLHAFMKYSNGSMSCCALIMPHKDRGKGGGGETQDRQGIMKERLIYLPLFTLLFAKITISLHSDLRRLSLAS